MKNARLLPANQFPQRRPQSRWFELFLFAVALSAAIYTMLAVMGVLQVVDPQQIPYVLAIDAILAALLLIFVGIKLFRLTRERNSGKPGARLHLRMVFLLGLASSLPTALVAGAAMVALEQGLTPWFSGNLKVLVENAGGMAQQYHQQLCQNAVREMRLMAGDIERAYTAGLYTGDRKLFRDFMTSRAVFLGLPNATIMKADGTVIERADVSSTAGRFAPSADEFAMGATDEPPCVLTTETIGSVMRLSVFDNAYLVVGRAVDRRAVEFPLIAQAGIEQYQALDARRDSMTLGVAVVFVLVTLLVLLGAVVLGLSLANQIVQPIGRLIQATDEVSSGNLYVQVPVPRVNDDISRLGTTFNKMTSVLRSQHDSLVAANDVNDQRRRFMEAVLAGVPAGVVGLDADNVIRVSNPTADAMLAGQGLAVVGRSILEVLPQLGEPLAEIRSSASRMVQRTIEVPRGGRERTISVRIAQEAGGGRGLVVTLDDITDLVAAQRTSAWADVARRIAHEIKNPLTPIQLSAERIRRKFGRVIQDDREIFDQCTDTIVRQVEDIKRMVDEFSSFARTPRPVMADGDVIGVVKEVAFMMRVAHPAIRFDEELPSVARAHFDRRLFAQAVQNIMKNATEGIMALPEEERTEPRILLRIATLDGGAVAVDIIDNGKGFPAENRTRLLEPYMTEREGGTGLGLAIVAKILEEHGGALELNDAPDGRGAWVRLLLPAPQNTVAAQDAAPIAANNGRNDRA